MAADRHPEEVNNVDTNLSTERPAERQTAQSFSNRVDGVIILLVLVLLMLGVVAYELSAILATLSGHVVSIR